MIVKFREGSFPALVTRSSVRVNIFWILDAVHRDNIWSWADISPGTEPAKPHFLDGRPDPAAAWDLNHNLLLVQTQLGLPYHYHTTTHSDSSFHKKALEINYYFKGYQQIDTYYI